MFKNLTYSCYPVYLLVIGMLMLLLIPLVLINVAGSIIEMPRVIWKDLGCVRSRFKYLKWESSRRTYNKMKEIWKV